VPGYRRGCGKSAAEIAVESDQIGIFNNSVANANTGVDGSPVSAHISHGVGG
jgi:hypothetical protein